MCSRQPTLSEDEGQLTFLQPGVETKTGNWTTQAGVELITHRCEVFCQMVSVPVSPLH